MPFNSNAKLVSSKSLTEKSAQDIQDDLFRKMSVTRKIKLASDFYRFGQELHKLGNQGYGTGRVTKKNR